jgi:pyruvate-ferredoxin/flavodoxin oxidoreductase
MWRGKQKEKTETARFPGTKVALDGHAAVCAVEKIASDVVLIQTGPELAEITGPLRNVASGKSEDTGRAPVVCHVDGLRALTAQASGYSASGLRTAAMVTGLSGVREALFTAAGERLTCVFNLTCRASRRQAGSLFGGHDDYYATAGSGALQMFARNVQEAADFALIAHRVAELSLTPALCAQDFYHTSHSVQNIQLPEPELVETYLGRPGDTIESPTPAQVQLFGPERRRIPALVDRDHPAGIGGTQDDESYFKALAAQHPFFIAHVGGIVDEALGEFARLTGRTYNKVTGYRIDDAQYVVVAQGAVVEAVEAVVDRLRRRGVKAGAVCLSVFRPFPGAEISRMLKGKKAVTVLERADQPMAEDLPLAREVRATVDKAVENAVGEEPIHPGYETYRKIGDRPVVCTGVYGVGGALPSLSDLAAVYDNMMASGGRKTRFYVGVVSGERRESTRRFPHLQALEQRLHREYPSLDGLILSGKPDDEAAEAPATDPGEYGSLELYSLASQGGIFALNLFAQTMSEALSRGVRTFPVGGLDPGLQPLCHTMAYATSGEVFAVQPPFADTLLVSNDRLLENVSSRSSARHGASIVVGSKQEPESLWRALTRRTRRWVRDMDVHLYTVDVAAIASQTTSQPSFTDQLAVWALFGAGLRLDRSAQPDHAERFVGTLRERLTQIFGAEHYLVNDIATAVQRGAEETAEIEWRSFAGEEEPVSKEPDAPWTVQQIRAGDGTVFDPARFWHSVGFLYDSGEAEQTLADPYLATGVVPGGSSAFRNMSPYRFGIPHWLTENCTGCGLCWAHCPDTALPATIQPVSSIIETAISQCEKDGATMVQMQRVSDHLAKQTYRVFAKDDLRQLRTMGLLMREAFSQLIEKMNLDEDKSKALQDEFEKVCTHVEHFPVARTQEFFDDPHKREKNSGLLLSIALNPLSCKGCGLCVEVCPENAMEWTDQTVEALETAHANWQWQRKLPTVPSERIAAHIDEDGLETEVFRLLDAHAYHSLVGGDGAFPGNSAKTAIHLVTAAIESVMQPRFEAHLDELSTLIRKLEEKIQGKVTHAVEINDFESFGREIGRLGKKPLTPEMLAKLAGDDSAGRAIDPVQLQRWNGLLSQLVEQRRRYVEGRARLILAIDPGGTTFWSGTYPDNPHTQPWMTHLPGDAPALAEGLFEGAARALADEIKVCRLAELEIDDAYDPEEHDALFERFTWREFNDRERGLIPPVLVVGYSDVTSWDEISRLISRGYPIKIAVVNTEGISIAGSAKGGLLSEPQEENDPGILALARRGAFVLQSTVGHPGHLIRGVVEGVSRPCPAVFHVHAPDALAHGIAPEKTAEQARLAFESRAFPLFSSDPGVPGDAGAAVVGTRVPLSLAGNPDPEIDWPVQEWVFKDANNQEEVVEAPLSVADWAIGEARFREHFTLHARGYLSDKMKVLPEYLGLDAGQRRTFEPFIHVKDEEGRHRIATLSEEMVRVTEQRLRLWTRLRELVAIGPLPVRSGATEAKAAESAAPAAPETETQAPATPSVTDQALYEKLTEKLLWFSGYSQDPDFFKQSLRDFLTRKREAEPGAVATETDKPSE